MRISEVMTRNVEYLAPDASLKDAALRMRELDCGFLPVSSVTGESLSGVITDRDIAVRAVAEGLDPANTSVADVMSKHVDYCFAGDALDSATRHMSEKGIYRLVVLDAKDSKQLCGVITLGDLLRHDCDDLAVSAAKRIVGHTH